LTAAAKGHDFDSYITGLRGHAVLEGLLRLRPGAQLLLRASTSHGASRTEVCTMQGEPLGWLPAEDSMALADAGDDGAAEVTALVPAKLLPRVHIRIFVAE
jgi:hypothetical protein